MPLHLKIVTPEKQIFDEEVSQVNVSTADGQLGILPNHVNLMAKLAPGELVIKRGGKEESLAIGTGFLQMAGNTLTVMTDLAVEEKDIDEKAMEEAKKKTEQTL